MKRYLLHLSLDDARCDILEGIFKQQLSHGWSYTWDIQIVLPFAVRAKSTTLIIVECIKFHQTNVLDNVHKVLTVFTGNKLRLCIFGIPLKN